MQSLMTWLSSYLWPALIAVGVLMVIVVVLAWPGGPPAPPGDRDGRGP